MSPSFKAQVDPLLMKQLIQKSNQKGILDFFSGPFWLWSSFISTIGEVLVFSGLSHLRYHFCFLRGRSP